MSALPRSDNLQAPRLAPVHRSVQIRDAHPFPREKGLPCEIWQNVWGGAGQGRFSSNGIQKQFQERKPLFVSLTHF